MIQFWNKKIKAFDVVESIEELVFAEPDPSPLVVTEIKKEFTPLDPAKMREALSNASGRELTEEELDAVTKAYYV